MKLSFTVKGIDGVAFNKALNHNFRLDFARSMLAEFSNKNVIKTIALFDSIPIETLSISKIINMIKHDLQEKKIIFKESDFKRKIVLEIIIQIGNMKEHAQLKKIDINTILIESSNELMKFCNCSLLNLAIHYDETTPHAHLLIVPYSFASGKFLNFFKIKNSRLYLHNYISKNYIKLEPDDEKKEK